MPDCERIRQQLAEQGTALADGDARLRAHLERCPECRGFLQSLRQLDATLDGLPPHEASATLLQQTAAAVAAEAQEQKRAPVTKPSRERYWASALAASVVILSAIGLTQHLLPVLTPPFSTPQDLLQPQQKIGVVGALAKQHGDQKEFASPAPESFADAPAESRVADRLPQPAPALERGLAEYEERARAVTGPFADADDDSSVLEDDFQFEAQGRYAGAPQEQVRPIGEGETLGAKSGYDYYRADAGAAASTRSEEEAEIFGHRGAGVAPRANQAGRSKDGERLETPRDKGETTVADLAQRDARLGTQGEFSTTEPQSLSPRSATPDGLSSRSQTRTMGQRGAERGAVGKRMLATQEKTRGTGRKIGAIEKNRELAAPTSESVTAGSGGEGQSKREAKKPDLSVGQPLRSKDKAAPPDPARSAARRFLAENASLEGLAFQEASGYWANTYIPGDPAMRLLETRLKAWDRSAFGTGVHLERAARQNWQPLDAPRNAALALYLHADHAAIRGPTRMRVQVGLKATRRQSGHRPTMNLGLVLDLRRQDLARLEPRVRALVSALHKARQPGDRFTITVAGRPGGLLVATEAFRHGPIKLALDSLFKPPPEDSEPALDLVRAVGLARETLRQGDDPTTTLGASLILLATGSGLSTELPALERLAHQSAVGGVPVSVVALPRISHHPSAVAADSLAVAGRTPESRLDVVSATPSPSFGPCTPPPRRLDALATKGGERCGAGNNLNMAEIDRLVSLGQGNRRILAAPAEAPALIDRELHAASRVVARAVRLRLRLAPGVKLIEVLGSRRLEEPQARRVRQAEQSIDQRMARNVGIQADRGEDEQGIQIVIPAFHSGDAQVILLDVVADRPGLIADATIRYKDLVHLRNGVGRARLGIEAGERAAGPLQLNVLKNRLALELAGAARQAGRQLAGGDHRAAMATLTDIRDLLLGMRQEIPGWSNDAELSDDAAMLTQYLTVLALPVAENPGQRGRLAESLRYSAHRKLNAEPSE